MGNEGLAEIAKKFDNDGAEAKTIIGYAKNREEIHFFEGALRGRIVEPRGETNFGWDPIFLPTGYETTFAQMSPRDSRFFNRSS